MHAKLLGVGFLLAAPADALHAVPHAYVGRSRSAVSSRSPPLSLTASLALDLGGNGGRAGGTGGRSGGGGGGGRGDWSGGDEGEGSEAPGILADVGLNPESVPADVLEALYAGRIGLAEMANWKAVLGSPAARLLATVGYVRNRLLAEPRLLTILSIELGLGCVCSFIADYAARGSKFGAEMDFVLANQVPLEAHGLLTTNPA